MSKWLRRNEQGFTLVELMMVIVILGILAGVTIPMVGRLRAQALKSKVVSTADAIESALYLYLADVGDFPKTKDDLDKFGTDFVQLPNNVEIVYELTESEEITDKNVAFSYQYPTETGDDAENKYTLTGYYWGGGKWNEVDDATRTGSWDLPAEAED